MLLSRRNLGYAPPLRGGALKISPNEMLPSRRADGVCPYPAGGNCRYTAPSSGSIPRRAMSCSTVTKQ